MKYYDSDPVFDHLRIFIISIQGNIMYIQPICIECQNNIWLKFDAESLIKKILRVWLCALIDFSHNNPIIIHKLIELMWKLIELLRTLMRVQIKMIMF